MDAPDRPERWKGLVIAILGGDEREQEIARLAVQSGARVQVFGFPMPKTGIAGAIVAESAADAVAGARIVLMPIPGIAADGSIFSTSKIIPRAELLSRVAPDAHIILGTADSGLRKIAADLGIGVHEYESDQELMLLRAPAIVEGALKIMIENTRITIHRANVCVLGQGNIGTNLARTLVLLNARVTVAARNAVQLAAAAAYGAATLELSHFSKHVPGFDIVASTVPVRVISKEIIDRLPQTALIMDLAAPPGSVDLEYAQSTGRTAIWARALGRRAPITVGASQWTGIQKTINKLLRTDA